ncbi:hypothetical protein ACUXST_000149 [Sphingomonas sp. F9_3S_D5_B_2]
MADILAFTGGRPEVRLNRDGNHWELTVCPPQRNAPTLVRFLEQHEAVARGLTLATEHGWRFRCWEWLRDGGSAA